MHKPMKHHRDYDDSNNNNHNIDISSQHDDDTSLVDNLDQGLIELTKKWYYEHKKPAAQV
jgi:hypothetical protein